MNTQNNKVSAEQSVLATMLTSSSENMIDVISDIIQVDDFKAVRHQHIYQACIDIAAENKEIDVVLVSRLMESRDQIGSDKCPDGYFAQLLLMPIFSPTSMRHHAEIIKSQSARRRSITVHQQAIQALEDATTVTQDVNNNSVSELSSIDIGGSDEQVVFNTNDRIRNSVERLQALKAGAKPFIGTGFADLDSILQLKAGELAVIAARPAMGKSLLVVNMQTHIAKYRDGHSVFFSVEMEEAEVTDRQIASEANITLDALKSGNLTEDDWANYQRFATEQADMRFTVVRKTNLTIGEIRTHLNKIKREHGKISSIAVDYLQIMAGTTDADSVKKIGAITRELKAMGSEFGCPVFLLSQLNRGVEQRPNKRPNMSDLRDSGTIEQDANQIVFIYRDDYYNENSDVRGIAEIIVAKNRNAKTGTAFLAFEPQYGRFRCQKPDYSNYGEDVEGYNFDKFSA